MKTEKIELVETHVLALSLKRLQGVRPYDGLAWRRALYHAMQITFECDRDLQKKIREALNLP